MANASYEAVVVYSVAGGEESVAAAGEKVKGLIEANAEIESVDEWGRRRLAYAINDENEGHYVLYNFSASPAFPAELDRVLKITDGVLRHLVIRKDA